MTRLASETVQLSIPRDRIWPIFYDSTALATILPGCESLVEIEPGRYRGIAATRLQFLTLRAEITAGLVDVDPPERLTLALSGRPLALAGGFDATVAIELGVGSSGGTDVRYEVDMTTSGRLASFGTPILRDALRRQIATLITNLERYVASGGAG